MAVDTQRWSTLRQMKAILSRCFRSRLVCYVTGVAAHVERGVAAAFIGNIRSLRVTGEAEAVLLIA